MLILRDENIKKTRKPHMCFGCCDVIPAGSPAHVQVNDDMGVGSIYSHIECQEIFEQMCHEGEWDDTYNEYCVIEYLRDMGFEGTPKEYINMEDQ